MMSEYVLVSQGIECARFNEPYEPITEAIKSNKEYYECLQRCAEEYECPADNEMFVYKEDKGKAIELDLFMCEQIINKARADERAKLFKNVHNYLLEIRADERKRILAIIHFFFRDELDKLESDKYAKKIDEILSVEKRLCERVKEQK